MSVAASGSNPAYSLQSVLSAQLAVFTEAQELSTAKGTNATADPAGAAATFNNLTTPSASAAPAATSDAGASAPAPSAAPAAASSQPSAAVLANANDDAGHLNSFLSVFA